MASSTEWALGYARQAHSDLLARKALATDASLSNCHGLHFLQMACEKLCKAHLCGIGSARPEDVQSSHAYIEKHLPEILASQYHHTHRKRRGRQAHRSKRFRSLAREVELLAPAVRAGGRRRENCEYPWEDADGQLHVPADHSFPALSLLHTDTGAEFLKLLTVAVTNSIAQWTER